MLILSFNNITLSFIDFFWTSSSNFWLKHICKDVGFKDVNNPFLKFLETYLDTNTLTNNDLVKLNNLYARDILSYEEIHGDKIDGNRFSIIYSPELYKMSDMEKVVKSYKFLGDANNLKKMNWKSIYDGNVTNNISQLALDIIDEKNKLDNLKDVAQARATIIYKDINSPELNSETIIDKTLKLGATSQTSQIKNQPNNNPTTNNELNANSLVKALRRLSVSDQRDFINTLKSELGLW